MKNLRLPDRPAIMGWLVPSPAVLLLLVNTAMAGDSLPSWSDTAPKQAIIRFVEQVSNPGSTAFVPPAERIATFDMDGTLWS